MKALLKLMLLLLLGAALIACQNETQHIPKIGIVLPLEHKALQEIVAGFTEKFQEIYHQPVQIKVMNAEGDVNIQRAIIQQMHDQNYTMIIPVATGVTEMTSAMIHDKPIVSLAADFSEEKRQQLHPCNIDVVQDDIPAEKLLNFIHLTFPHLTKLTLIHSTSDKILPDVKNAMASGKKVGIEVKPLMVATLPELAAVTQALPADTQAIFILKDNLIASGIATLVKTANEKHIALFTSDQGTVESGAGFSLGVHERQIGAEGAKIAAAVLNGAPINSLPMVTMNQLTVFINKKALLSENQNVAEIVAGAKKLNYHVEMIN